MDFENVVAGFSQPERPLEILITFRKAILFLIAVCQPVVSRGNEDVELAVLGAGNYRVESQTCLIDFPDVGQHLRGPEFGDGRFTNIAGFPKQVPALFKFAYGPRGIAVS